MRNLLVVVGIYAALSVADSVANLPFSIDLAQLTTVQLTSFCQGETGTCAVLCNSNTLANSCLQTPSLTWTCTCRSNSSEPGLQYYETSMFSYLCEQAYGQCMSTHAGDLMAQQSQCVSGIHPKCGTLQTNALASATAVLPSTTTAATVTTTTHTSATSATTASATTQPNIAPSQAVLGGGAAAIMALGMLAQAL